MKKLIVMLVIGLVMGVVGVGNTAQTTIEFEYEIQGKYDRLDSNNSTSYNNNYNNSWVYYEERYGLGSISFDNVTVKAVIGCGNSTITYLTTENTQWSTMLPIDKSAFNGDKVIENSMRGNVYDSDNGLSESVSYETSMTSTEGSLFYQHYISLSYYHYSDMWPRPEVDSGNGIGLLDYAFTPESYADFWKRSIGAYTDSFYFEESYRIMDLDTNEWITDIKWYGNIYITDVQTAPVPIPATVLLLGTGLAGLMMTKHKRKTRTKGN